MSDAKKTGRPRKLEPCNTCGEILSARERLGHKCENQMRDLEKVIPTKTAKDFDWGA